MAEAFIIDAVRTPRGIGRTGGKTGGSDLGRMAALDAGSDVKASGMVPAIIIERV